MQKLFFLFITIAFINNSYSQVNPYNEVSIASPNSASLGKYIDVPVSYHTGLPQISIPIYTIKEGHLELPISLSYHAGGLKVMEAASWVGAGWSLIAGGVITRTVRGAPDERNTSSVNSHIKGFFSDYGYLNYQTGTCTENNVIVPFCGKEFADGTKDGEPDLFFFNVNGYSGKFYFNDDRTPVLIPSQDIVIKHEYSEGNGSIKSFTLITPDGIKYHFGRTIATDDVDPIEITDPFTSQSGFVTGMAISSWYLNKVESADGVFAISLKYEAEQYGLFNISTYSILNDNVNDHWGINCVKNIINGVRLKSIHFSNGNVLFTPGSLREDLSTALPSMDSDLGIHNANSLGEIIITNNAGYCQKYKFDYEYFIDNTTPLSVRINYPIISDKKRLKFKKIQQSSCDGTIIIPPYLFEYYTEQVPRRLSCGQDHWGFINGIASNSGLIPTYTLNDFNTVYRADRDTKWPAMRAGTLKKIIYPTSGITELDFEPNSTWVNYNTYNANLITSNSTGYDGNQSSKFFSVTFLQQVHKIKLVNTNGGGNAFVYTPGGEVTAAPGQTVEVIQSFAPGTYTIELKKSTATTGNGTTVYLYDMVPQQVQENKIVGGLRIKSIAKKDNVTAINNVTNYTYTDANQKSSGILYSRPTYIQYIRNDLIGEVGYGGSYPNGFETPYGCPAIGVYAVSPGSLRPLSTTQGSHIGYNDVKVSNNGNGYSTYNYYGSNYWDNIQGDICVRNLISAPCSFNIPNHPEAPFPFEYKRGELKHESHYTESSQLIKSIDYYHVFEENKLVTPCVIASQLYGRSITFYDIKTSRKKEFKTIEYNAGLNQTGIQTTTTVFYESDKHNQITRQTSTNSKGELIETKYKYAKDFVLTCDQISDGHQDYLNNALTLKNNYLSSLINCNSDCRRIKFQQYHQNLSNTRLNYINYRRTNFTNSSNVLINCRTNFKSNANSELKPIIELQDENKLVPIETSNWKNGLLVGASFNKFDFGTNPSNKVYLKNSQVISLNSLSSIFTNAIVNGYSITKDSRYTDEATLKYNQGNLVELIKKDGITTSYKWGHNNTVPIVKAVGVNHTTLEAAYSAVGGNLLTLRDHSSLSYAMVSTYIYNPLVGLTSETDQRKNKVNYEYDAIGRLSVVRDKDNNILKKICYSFSGQVEACIANVNVNHINTTTSPYTLSVTNSVSGTVYTFSLYPNSSVQLSGLMPPGTYNISVTPVYSGSTVNLTYNSTTLTGTSFNISSLNISNSITFTLQPAPSTGPCSFTMKSGYFSPTNSISNSGGTVSFYMVFQYNAVMNPGVNYYIADVNGSCRPTVAKTVTTTINGRVWTITIHPGGTMIWQFSGSSISANSTVSTSTLTYNLN